MEKLEQFRLYLVRCGKSPGTIEKHTASLKTIWREVQSLEPEKIDSFILLFLQKGRSKEYLNLLIQATRAWGDFIKDERYKQIKYFTVNPEESHKSFMSDSELKEFLLLPPIENKNASRASNKELYQSLTLYFKILIFSGMRPGEAAGLRAETVDFGRNVFDLIKTKTNIPRLVPIQPIIIDELQIYIKSRKQQALFIDEKGRPLQRHIWKHHFNHRLQRLGIKRPHLTVNSFRDAFITRQLEEGVPLKIVQEIVGHRKIITTARYTHFAIKAMQNAIKQDRLAKDRVSYNDRFNFFYKDFWSSLENNANTVEEKKKMLFDLWEMMNISKS